MKTILSFIFLLSFVVLDTQAQKQLTLNEAIQLAQKQSYDALIAENEYMAAYWNYRNYQTSILPTIDLSARPTTSTVPSPGNSIRLIQPTITLKSVY